MKKLLLMMVAVFLVSGCEAIDNYIAEKSVASQETKLLEEKVIELEEKIASLEKKLSDGELEEKIINLEKKLSDSKDFDSFFRKLVLSTLDSLENTAPSSAFLEPTSKKYSVAGNGGCFFAVSCDDIKAYGRGSELTFTVVNLSGVGATGTEVIITPATIDGVTSETKEYVFRISSIDSGGSHREKVGLKDIKPEEIKSLTVTVRQGGISYSQPKKK